MLPDALLWRPFFPPLPILLGAAALALLALWAFRRTYPQAPVTSVLTLPMRLALIAAIAVLLLGPSVLPESTALPGRPRVTFMLDASASMQTPDVASKTRYDFATSTWLDPTRLARLCRNYDVELVAFGESPRAAQPGELYRPASDAATAGTTRVIESVGATLATMPQPTGESPGLALVLISDGRDNADGDAASVFASSRRVPVHTVSLGGPNLQRDLAVVAVPLQEYLLAGEEGQIAVRVIGSGADGASTTLRLKGPDGETSEPITFGGEYAVRVSLPVKHAEPGTYEYQVLVDPLPGEAETRNNAQPVFVEVTKQRLAVLLLEGSPYWDTKFLAQSLRKDDRIELVQIAQVSPEKRQRLVSRDDASTRATSAGGAASTKRDVPQTLAEMRRYDVIILGAGMEHVLTAESARALVEYVTEAGGRVIFARGRAYDPSSPMGPILARELAPLEPVVWGDGTTQDVRLALDGAGESHPAFALGEGVAARRKVVAELPPLLSLHEVKREKAAAQVLARTAKSGLTLGGAKGGQPVVTAMPAGRGMTFAVLGEGLWKWSLVARENDELAGVFDRFWSNNIRWLVMGGEFQPGRELSLRLSRRSVQVGEAMLIDVGDRDAVGAATRQVSLSVVAPDGTRHQPAVTGDDPARKRATFEPRLPGVYRVIAEAGADVQPVESSFNVYELDLERLECSANPRLMRLLAEETGGQVLDPFAPDALEDILEAQRQAAIVPPRPEYVWDEAWIMTLLLAWCGTEWIVRKKGGLL